MSRTIGTSAGLLGLLLASAPPAVGQQWEMKCRLSAPVQLPDSEFGAAVAAGKDGTIAVGDYRNDVVYLFRQDGAGGCARSTIQGPDRGAWFGFALAIDDGDVLLVGAPKRGAGVAYRIALQDGRPAGDPQPLLTLIPQPAAGDEVGSSVAIFGDNLAIGARGAESRRGRVYYGSESSLKMVSVGGLAPSSELGQSVALSGTALVMGAPSPYRASGSPGAAYVVKVTSTGVEGEPSRLVPGGLEPEAAFGYAVAVDVKGGRVLVGAPLADRSGQDSGAVYSFALDGTNGGPLSFPGHPGDQLGVAVAADDGMVVAGARYAHDNNQGEAYLEEAEESLGQRLEIPNEAQFGSSVAIRKGIVVVGAPREQTDGGAAYLFEKPPVEEPPVPVKVELAAASSAVQESSGKAPLLVIIRGSAGGLSAPVTVDLKIEAGTATGDDFKLRKLRYVIPPGTPPDVPYQLAEVEIVPDELPEGPETFIVRLDQSFHEVTIYDSFLLVVPAGPLQTSEAGASAPLEIRLAVEPSAKVVVSLNTSDPGEGRVSRDRLVFMPEKWQQTKTVQVKGRDDELCDGSRSSEIRATTTSADPRYNGLSVSVRADNADDELACLAFERTACRDQGGTVVYTIALSNEASNVPDAPAELRGTLPAGVTVVTASADRGVATADPIANSVRWVGTVPPEGGGAATITIVAALDDPLGPVPAHLANLFYVRDGRGHRETREIGFGDVKTPCP